MRLRNMIILTGFVLLLNGCSAGQMIKYNYQGGQYLKTQNYAQGESTFFDAVAQNPSDPTANYYLGRFLLANNKPKEALPYLQKAVKLNQRDTNYLFWQGIAYGESGNSKEERQSYEQVLKINKKHVQALTYLGHNQLREKEYEAALSTYQKVLKISPNNPSALYNRALIAKILNQSSEEKAGWLAYLENYPSGDLAILAINHLNQLGDFSYKNHYLGARTIPLVKISFEPFSDKLYPSSKQALDVVGATATNIGRGKLQVLVFQENNKELAKARAIAIKQYLNKTFPALASEKIGVSWFGQPETLEAQGEMVQNPDSVSFFLSDLKTTIKPGKTKKKVSSLTLTGQQTTSVENNVTFYFAPRIEG